MDIEYLDNLDEMPEQKRHTVARGEYVKVLTDFLESGKNGMVIRCESVEEATRKHMGLYNLVTKRRLPVKVWRRGPEVFVKKLEEN